MLRHEINAFVASSLAVVRTVAEGGAWTLFAGSLVVALFLPAVARGDDDLDDALGARAGSAIRAVCYTARGARQPIRSRLHPRRKCPTMRQLQAIRRPRIPTRRRRRRPFTVLPPPTRPATAAFPYVPGTPPTPAAPVPPSAQATIGSPPRQPNIGTVGDNRGAAERRRGVDRFVDRDGNRTARKKRHHGGPLRGAADDPGHRADQAVVRAAAAIGDRSDRAAFALVAGCHARRHAHRSRGIPKRPPLRSCLN